MMWLLISNLGGKQFGLLVRSTARALKCGEQDVNEWSTDDTCCTGSVLKTQYECHWIEMRLLSRLGDQTLTVPSVAVAIGAGYIVARAQVLDMSRPRSRCFCAAYVNFAMSQLSPGEYNPQLQGYVKTTFYFQICNFSRVRRHAWLVTGFPCSLK